MRPPRWWNSSSTAEGGCHGRENADGKLLAELDTVKGIGLIERVKQGQGRPTKIFVKNFSRLTNSPINEALIDPELWDVVQRLREQRCRTTRTGEPALFSGVLFCADCGNRLAAHMTTTKENFRRSYICGRYKNTRGVQMCGAHYIREDVLIDLVLGNLRDAIAYAKNYEDEFVRQMTSKTLAEQTKQQTAMKRQLEQQTRRIGEIDSVIQRIYEDMVTPTKGGEQEMLFIPEGDIYRLAAKSELPGADEFESWIFDEVLPSIRKHGAYMTPETLEAAILNPDTMIKLCTALKDEQDKRKALEVANSALTVETQIMKPKADYFDELVCRNLLTNFRETAKQLEVKERDFIQFLINKKYIYRDKRGKLLPYAQHADNGLFEIKECFNERTQWSGTQTLVTPKGRETFRLLFIGVA